MSETAYVSDIFQLIDMKVLITEDSLDSLLSIKISQDGGKTYTDHSVSSLKNGGITFDCSPNNLKVICDANVLKYIQVLADGEKASSSDILSNYIKIEDFYVDVYKNPYYGKDLTQEEVDKLQGLESALYDYKKYQYYCCGKDFEPYHWQSSLILVKQLENYGLATYYKEDFICTQVQKRNSFSFYYVLTKFNTSVLHYDLRILNDKSYLTDIGSFFTNARVHFIKHF